MLLCEGAWLVMQMWPDGRSLQVPYFWGGGGIWEYWRDIAMPTGRGIEAQVEEVSSELETKNLFKATLIGPGKVFSRLGR